MAKHICVIGAGASGITCIKEALVEGFTVTCYEKGGYVGGLWHYHDEDDESIASVMRSTIINSSKELSAYSDFPPPKELPNYMHNSQMIKYLEMYAKNFGVEKHVQFHRQVVRVVPATDYDLTGRWSVTTSDLKNSGVESTETFDAIMVATGHHVKPIQPKFKGQEKFRGRILHTHSYKKPDGFDDQNVVVVGIGNSGGDAAAELSAVGKQVYLSTRRGVWMLYRVGPGGDPFDSTFLRRFWDILFAWTPFGITCALGENLLNSRFDHEKYGLKPKHRIFQQHPMVNDALPNRILSGTVQIKDNIAEFTEDGVIFEGETKVTPVDSVIMATGYEVSFPFLDKSVLWTENNEVELYKYVFNPRLAHPETLAFIGLVQVVGPAIPFSEMQARWHCHLLKGRSRLPDVSTMLEEIKANRKEIADRYFEGPRHTMQVDWIKWLDDYSGQFGARPSLLKYLFTDPKLWFHLFFGPSFPYQYRLTGPGKWTGARKAIIEGQTRIDAPFKTKATLNGSRQLNGVGNGHVKNNESQSAWDSLVNVLFLLSYFPYLVTGVKYAAIVLVVLIISSRVFPKIFGF